MTINIDKEQSGGWPINSIRPINDSVDLREKNGQTWLKTGYVETDASLYPTASNSDRALFTGVVGDLTSFGENLSGFVFFDNHYWVLVSGAVFKVDVDYNYTGQSFDISSTLAGSAVGITTDQNYFYVIDTNEVVYRFNLNWSSTGFDFFANTITTAVGIAFNGTNLVLLNSSGTSDNDVEEWTVSGSRVGTAISELSPETNESIGFSDNSYWVTYSLPCLIESYDLSGEKIKSYELPINYCTGFLFDGQKYTALDRSGYLREVTLTKVVGISTAYTDSETGIPYYTRIK